MSPGRNLQHLRRLADGMTQEKLAEKMNVSRQTVSKWEQDDGYPELEKLVELYKLFSCTLDALVREDLAAREGIYENARIETVPGFRMARYAIVSASPEDDANERMRRWARESGLEEFTHGNVRMIGWDFPWVSQEQRSRFGMHGYAAACVLPEGFEPACGGVELARQMETRYAVLTIREPFVAPFERIPGAYKLLLEYLNANGFREARVPDALPCFERVYEAGGVTYMDVYMRV